MSFLTAEWRKLALANYEVEPELLADFVPAGTELDFWKGKCHVSLVGFMFMNTKLLGFKVPFHVNFEEVNLRFYVRRFENDTMKRGVVFIKELVPKPALTFVANTVYKENYETMPMKHYHDVKDEKWHIGYHWKKAEKWNSFKVVADLNPIEIEPVSDAEFITEHYWGYAKIDSNTTNEYQVRHPRWQQYRVGFHETDVDFGLVYGDRFAFLNALKPASVMLAEGSAISVEQKKLISF
jgi:hypothetical protein